MLALLDLIAQVAAAVPGGHVILVPGWPAAGMWAGVLWLGWWLWRVAGRRWVLAARGAFAAAVIAWGSLFARAPADAEGALTVHFLDVGQGDAAVLHTPHGHWIVIDGGPRTPEQDQGRRVVVPFLRRLGVEELALVVATHGDADHLGGLPAVLEAFPTRLAFEPGEPLGRPLYLEWLAAVQRDGADWHPARAGDRVEVDGVVLRVLSPDSAWMTTPVDVNDHGVVLLVSFGTRRVLFQADAGVSVESRLRGQVGPVDVLKVGHHGSSTASSEAWLDELTPAEAVISVGAQNRYGHPSPEVVRRLERHGSIVLRTDHDGTVTWETDGQTERTHPDLRNHD
jgi:competence protein ComEC